MKRGIAGITLAGSLLLTGCTSDPVTECGKAAGPVWERALDAQTVAELEALPGIWTLSECRDLTADQRQEFRRENSATGDRIVTHTLRVALTEGEN